MLRSQLSYVQSRLAKAGLRSNTDLGQHFLVDDEVLNAIVEAAELKPGEAVVEIGPGLGVLTERLLQVGANVLAFELDPGMAAILAEDFQPEIESGQLQIIVGDALQKLPERVQSPYKVVANIPYQITTPLFELLFERNQFPRPELAVLLVQKEVAGRLTAPAGASQRGFLSVLAEYLTQTKIVRFVGPKSFSPEPNVDSAVLKLEQRPERERSGLAELVFLRFVKSGFQHRRKQLKNVVAGIKGVDSNNVSTILSKIGLPISSRAQELTLASWLALEEELK